MAHEASAASTHAPALQPAAPPAVTRAGVTTGVVTFEETPSDAPAASSHEDVQRAVERAAGKAGRVVRVRPRPGGVLDLQVTLSNADGWEEVLHRLEALPELAGRQVDWNISLAP